MLDEFLKIITAYEGNPYVWGGQGDLLTKDNYKTKINKMETSAANRKNAIAFTEKALKKQPNGVLCFDCSGLGMYAMQNKMKKYGSDRTANGIMSDCTKISKSQLTKGCFVFRVSGGKAYHIGYVVDDNLNVIEAMGRKYGVVKRKLNASGASYWNAFGIHKFFKDEIQKAQQTEDAEYTFTRNLKYGSKGDDVKNLQRLLNKNGFSCGSIDGDFGKNTRTAVKNCQKAAKLTADGVAGAKTITALGGTWGTKTTTTAATWTVSRTLKKGLKGDDVKHLQTALIKKGYSCGSTGADGDFGGNTDKAVKLFQKTKGLSVDGIAGKNTITALGGKWKG